PCQADRVPAELPLAPSGSHPVRELRVCAERFMTWRETVPGRLQGHEHGHGCEGAFSRGCGLFGLSVVLIIVAGNNSKSGSAMAGASLFLISVLLGVGDCIVALTRWW